MRFFFSPVAAVFFPASFFSAGALAAGALLAAGFFSAAPFGGILTGLVGFVFLGEVMGLGRKVVDGYGIRGWGVVKSTVDDRWRRKKREGKGFVTMEVAPASYTSAKSSVVIRVREAGNCAKPEREARFVKSTIINGMIRASWRSIVADAGGARPCPEPVAARRNLIYSSDLVVTPG